MNQAVHASEPITSLAFSSQSLSDNDLIVFDEVAFRAVPEPIGASAVMVAALMVLLQTRAPLQDVKR